MLRNEAKQELAKYVLVFPDQKSNIAALAAQLESDFADVFDRKNMVGHITTTAFVVDVRAKKVLLIHHKLYDRWLSPGGHHEGVMTTRESAVREVEEETGVEDAEIHSWFDAAGCPWDIDTHAIGAQPAKAEGEHVHHDFIYLVTADSTKPLTPQKSEVFGAKWVTLPELREIGDPRLTRMADKLERFGIIP